MGEDFWHRVLFPLQPRANKVRADSATVFGSGRGRLQPTTSCRERIAAKSESDGGHCTGL